MELPSEGRQNKQPPLLLLVKVERLRLSSSGEYFYVSMSNPTLRTNDYCVAANCDPTYLWANQSVVLYLYVTNSSQTLASYEAKFFVTEATNVCGLMNRSADLVVQNSHRKVYAFASEPRHSELPPNNATCTYGFNYSMTLRSSVASASLLVPVLACPTDKSCATLLLDGRSCSDSLNDSSAPPGLPITLSYVLRRCNDHSQFLGFVVSAVASVPVEQPSATATVSSRATSVHATAERRLVGNGAVSEVTATVVAASVTAVAATALVIGITVALMCHRRRRLRPSSKQQQGRAFLHSRSAASAGAEEIAMLENDLYGVALASTITAHL